MATVTRVSKASPTALVLLWLTLDSHLIALVATPPVTLIAYVCFILGLAGSDSK